MEKQTRLPPALAALHNFIQRHNPDDIDDFNDIEDSHLGVRAEEPAIDEGQLAEGNPRAAER